MPFKYEYLRSKVARRIFSLFVFAALVPILLTTYLSYREVSHLIEQERLAQLKREAKQLSLTTYERLATIKNRLTAAAEMALHDRSTTNITSLLRSISTSAALFDGNGKVIETFTVPGGNGQLLEPVADTSSKPNLKLFTLPDKGEGTAVLMQYHLPPAATGWQHIVIRIDPEYLWSTELLSFETHMAVFNDAGKLLFRDKALGPKQLEAIAPRGTQTSSAGNNGGPEMLVNSRRLFLQAQFNTGDWIFSVAQPRSVSLAELTRFRTYFIPPILLSLMLITLVSLIAIRRNLIPIDKLLHGTRQIGLNNFDHIIDIDSGDEFSALAESFNKMTSQLKQQFYTYDVLSEMDQLILADEDITSIAASVLNGLQTLFYVDSTCLILPAGAGSTAYVLSRDKDFFCAHNLDIAFEELAITPIKKKDGNTGKSPEIQLLNELQKTENPNYHTIPIVDQNQIHGLIIAIRADKAAFNKEVLASIADYACRVAVVLAAHRRNEELVYQANIDGLTKIPNRQQMKVLTAQAIERCLTEEKRGALLFIDLDRFKNVNDAYGHPVGDRLLTEAAARLKSCLGPAQTVSRFGGDEFAILIPVIENRKTAEDLATTVIHELSLPYNLDKLNAYVGASVGVAFFPDTATTFDELLQNADTAMYEAKKSGRDQFYVYTKELGRKSFNRSVLEGEIRDAIANDGFSVHYQPKVSLRTGMIKGFEALLRWQHQSLGFVSPLEIIAVAEESVLIHELGDWVMNRVCTQIQSWQNNNLTPLPVAVNVSSKQLMNADYLQRLEQIIRRSDMDHQLLEIEITESLLVNDYKKTKGVLDSVHNLGLKIAIDDFGTGFSSLGYLGNLPIDILKIDRSFIDTIDDPDRNSAIVTTIIAMAYNLNLEVVAEGVENGSQLAFLQRCQCHEIQGYFFSKPVTADEAAQMLAKPDMFVARYRQAIQADSEPEVAD